MLVTYSQTEIVIFFKFDNWLIYAVIYAHNT